MTADDPVTLGLVEALIGKSHAELRGETQTALAELNGKVDVLTSEQRRAREASSREHALNQSTLDRIDKKLDGALVRIDAVEDSDDRAAAKAGEASRWKRRFWAMAVAAVPFVLFAGERLLPTSS